LRRAASALAAVASAALFLLLAFRVWKELPAVYPLDGEVDWALARAFLAGDNPYTPEGVARYHLSRWGGVPHPPTCALWFLPLARVPLDRLNQGLGLVVITLLAGQLLVICRELRVPFASAAAFLMASIVLLQGWFVHHLGVAQISGLIAFLVVIAWYALRREREVEAGVAVGLACTLKLFPGALLLYLLVTGRRRACAAAVATFLAAAAVVTARFGTSSWWLFVAHKPLSDQWIGRRYNASLEAIMLRLAHPAAAGPAPFDGWVPVIYPVLMLVLLAGGLWLVRSRGREPVPMDLSFAFIASLATLLNPWVWPHYDVLLVLPALLVATALHRAWKTRLHSRAVTGAAIALAVVVAAQTVLWLFRGGARLLELASWVSWPAITAAAALLLRPFQGQTRPLQLR
jgi:hypothetical protein